MGDARRSTGPDPRRALGRRGEDLALAHLHALGFSTVTRNHRTRRGEIDLIVFDGSTLVFVEVKTRSLGARPAAGPRAQTPLEGWHHCQRGRLRRLAGAWLAETDARPRARQLRIDAVGVLLDARGQLVRLDHLEGVL